MSRCRPTATKVSRRGTKHLGFNCGKSPIGAEDVNGNLGSPAIEKQLAVGVTCRFSDKVSGSFTCVHCVHNSITLNLAPANTIELGSTSRTPGSAMLSEPRRGAQPAAPVDALAPKADTSLRHSVHPHPAFPLATTRRADRADVALRGGDRVPL